MEQELKNLKIFHQLNFLPPQQPEKKVKVKQQLNISLNKDLSSSSPMYADYAIRLSHGQRPPRIKRVGRQMLAH